MDNYFDPFGIFRLPLSGNVDQRITTPWFSPTFNFAGDPAIEESVVRDVASYGTQIGWLNEIVLALAKKEEPSPESVGNLAKAINEIEAIKNKHRRSLLDAAVDALEQLKAEQPNEYTEFIKKRNA